MARRSCTRRTGARVRANCSRPGAGATAYRSLGLPGAEILAISSRDEMAILLRPRVRVRRPFEGTLARAPFAGGTSREVLEGVLAADWSPDGKALAVIHAVGERYRLEYPDRSGPVRAGSSGLAERPQRFSRRHRIAFVEHPLLGDARGGISIVGANEPRRSLASGFTAVDSARWSPDGREVWFNASRAGGAPHQIWAVSLTGRERVIEEQAGLASVADVSRSGRVLIRRGTLWVDTRARAKGASEEVELHTTDFSFLDDLSDDGKQVLGTDEGVEGGPNFSFYVQKTDGSAPVWLGEGDGQALSPDGRLVLAC